MTPIPGIHRDGRKPGRDPLPAAGATGVGAPDFVLTLAAASASAAGEPGTTQISSSSAGGGAATRPAGRRIVTRRVVAIGPSATGALRTCSSGAWRPGFTAATAGTGAACLTVTVSPDAAVPGPRRFASAATAVRIASSSVLSGGGPGGGAGSRLIGSSVCLYPRGTSWEQHHATGRRGLETLSAPPSSVGAIVCCSIAARSSSRAKRGIFCEQRLRSRKIPRFARDDGLAELPQGPSLRSGRQECAQRNGPAVPKAST